MDVEGWWGRQVPSVTVGVQSDPAPTWERGLGITTASTNKSYMHVCVGSYVTQSGSRTSNNACPLSYNSRRLSCPDSTVTVGELNHERLWIPRGSRTTLVGTGTGNDPSGSNGQTVGTRSRGVDGYFYGPVDRNE